MIGGFLWTVQLCFRIELPSFLKHGLRFFIMSLSGRIVAGFLGLVLVLLTAGAVQAKEGCYSLQEAEAEQGIRIHSELMVIGLNCQHMTPAGWKNFYQQYREITAKNSDLFAGYEETLINYYARSGVSNPEGRLHDLRTEFANKVSTDAAQMRPDVFCANYAPRLPKAAQMSREDLRNWAATVVASHPVSHPVCEQ